MAPAGLVISKLALQATADDHTLRGLLCLKISLPKEAESSTNRWPLFNSPAPRLASAPEIHPLPLSQTQIGRPRVKKAAALLSLSADHHSPSPLSASRASLDVSGGSKAGKSANGQVYVSIEGGRKRRDSVGSSSSSPGMAARREWVVIMSIEQDIERDGRTLQARLPIPKCLDNVLRLHILPLNNGPMGEVDIITEPKILPLPPGTFAHFGGLSERNRLAEEDGWEDGEVGGPELVSTGSESGDEGGWLEGRFQGADSLKLEWAFAPSSSTPLLHLRPDLSSRCIHFAYEQSLYSAHGPTTLSADLPPEWGFTRIQIQADGLRSWRCPTDDALSASLVSGDESLNGIDDSFSTIRANTSSSPTPMSGGRGTYPPTLSRAPLTHATRSSASLMHQTLPVPDTKIEDFSFELDPTSPVRTSSKLATPRARPSSGRLITRGAMVKDAIPADEFILDFDRMDEEVVVLITGTITPISASLLVSPSIATLIPLFSIGEPRSQCLLSYETTTDQPLLVTPDDRPTIRWIDSRGTEASSSLPGLIEGGLDVRIGKDAWGKQSATVSFEWPRKAKEVCLGLSGLGKEQVRVVQVKINEKSGQWAMNDTGDGEPYLTLGRPHGVQAGRVELRYGAVGAEGVLVPVIKGRGDMKVSLESDWGDTSNVISNMRQLDSSTFIHPLSTSSTEKPYITLPPSTSPSSSSDKSSSLPGRGKIASRALWSWSTLLNMFTLYLLLSLAQQVQRLRLEVAFVQNEWRDLREYPIPVGQHAGPGYGGPRGYDAGMDGKDAWSDGKGSASDMQGNGQYEGGTDTDGLLGNQQFTYTHSQAGNGDHQKCSTGPDGRCLPTTDLGRVVIGQSVWDKWIAHPSVRSLSQSLRWVWGAVVWLLNPA